MGEKLSIKAFFSDLYKKANVDLLETLKNLYLKIPSIDKKIFWILFFALNFVFIFNTTNFLWGNHEWSTLKNGLEIDSFFFNSRYTGSLLKTLLTQGQILPVLNNVLGFFFFSLGITFVLNYLKASKNLIQRMLIGFLMCLTPFTYEWIWFQRHTIENLAIPLFCILGLIISEKHKSLPLNALSILLFLIALGIYPSAIVNILCLFLIKIIIDYLENFDLKSVINSKKQAFVNIFISSILYKLIMSLFQFFNLSILYYANEFATFDKIIDNIPKGVRASFIQLYQYSHPLMPNLVTTLFLILFIILILYAVKNLFKLNLKEGVKRLFITLTFIFILLVSSKIAAIMSTDNCYFHPRIDMYGLVFIRAFVILLIFKYCTNFIKNITYVLVLSILWVSIVFDFEYQKAHQTLFTAHLINTVSILNRIEENPNFDPKREYKIIPVGYTKIKLEKFIPENNLKQRHNATYKFDKGMYIPEEYAANLEYFTTYKFKMADDIYFNRDFINGIITKYTNEPEEFPNKNSIFVDQDKIIIIFNKNFLKIRPKGYKF